jgi:hypothetical protein
MKDGNGKGIFRKLLMGCRTLFKGKEVGFQGKKNKTSVFVPTAAVA